MYLYLSLRNFFRQGQVITGIKFLAMAFVYSLVTTAGLLSFAAVLCFLFQTRTQALVFLQVYVHLREWNRQTFVCEAAIDLFIHLEKYRPVVG